MLMVSVSKSHLKFYSNLIYIYDVEGEFNIVYHQGEVVWILFFLKKISSQDLEALISQQLASSCYNSLGRPLADCDECPGSCSLLPSGTSKNTVYSWYNASKSSFYSLTFMKDHSPPLSFCYVLHLLVSGGIFYIFVFSFFGF